MNDIAVGVKSLRLEQKLEQSYEKLRQAITGTVEAMAQTVEMRAPYTAGHQRRVAELAFAIATEMELSEEQVEGLNVAVADVVEDMASHRPYYHHALGIDKALEGDFTE
ncbi:MAG: hypothetical protein FJ006_00940 [Chloroflexi bacterium]|nr:hypothetical protein [Chloroflexota bacterium]